jgi:hypothetical protein
MRGAIGFGVVLICGMAPVGARGTGSHLDFGRASIVTSDDSIGVGTCPYPPGDTTPLGQIVDHPDAKPRRLDLSHDLTVGQGAYRLETDEDLDKGLVGNKYRVGVSALIDTAGRAIPGSVTITSSDNARLSQAICDAMKTMRFKPGKKGSSLVFAMYAEKLTFYSTGAGSTDRGPQSQSSVR